VKRSKPKATVTSIELCNLKLLIIFALFFRETGIFL